MKRNVLTAIYSVVHIVLSSLLLYIATSLYIQYRLFDVNIWPLRLFILHILLATIGLFLTIRLPATSRNEIETRILPLFYISLNVTNLPLVIPFFIHNLPFGMSFTFIARLYVVAMLFSMCLALFQSLFHVGINTGKLLQYMLLAFAFSVLVGSLIPLSVSQYPYNPTQWFFYPNFIYVPVVIGLLSVITAIMLMLKERDQYVILRHVSMILIVSGNSLYFTRMNNVVLLVALILFSLGIVLGIPRQRFSQLQ